MTESIDTIDINKINLLENRTIAVGASNMGKTYTITNIIFDNVIKTEENIKIIIFSGSFTDFDIFFRAIICYTLRRKGVVINNRLPIELFESINNFKIMNKLNERELKEIVNNCNKIINNVLNNYLNNIINYLKQQSINLVEPLKTKATFEFKNNAEDFNEYIDGIKKFNSIKTISKLDPITNLYEEVLVFEKILFLFDDIESEVNKKIKTRINYLFEQGRHKNIGVIFIDQYIKSPKISPLIRDNSKYILFRTIGKSDIEYIVSKITNEIPRLESRLQKCIDDKYCLILYQNRLYKFKAEEHLYDMFKN